MKYSCKKIEITNSELGVQVGFENLNGDSDLYFLIQKHFDEEDDRDEGNYIESHNFDIAGHYHPKIKLSKSRCEFEFGKNRFVVNYEIDAKKFKELNEVLEILGSVEMKN